MEEALVEAHVRDLRWGEALQDVAANTVVESVLEGGVWDAVVPGEFGVEMGCSRHFLRWMIEAG